MKKIIALMLIFVFILGLTGCGKKKGSSDWLEKHKIESAEKILDYLKETQGESPYSEPSYTVDFYENSDYRFTFSIVRRFFINADEKYTGLIYVINLRTEVLNGTSLPKYMYYKFNLKYYLVSDATREAINVGGGNYSKDSTYNDWFGDGGVYVYDYTSYNSSLGEIGHVDSITFDANHNVETVVYRQAENYPEHGKTVITELMDRFQAYLDQNQLTLDIFG